MDMSSPTRPSFFHKFKFAYSSPSDIVVIDELMSILAHDLSSASASKRRKFLQVRSYLNDLKLRKSKDETITSPNPITSEMGFAEASSSSCPSPSFKSILSLDHDVPSVSHGYQKMISGIPPHGISPHPQVTETERVCDNPSSPTTRSQVVVGREGMLQSSLPLSTCNSPQPQEKGSLYSMDSLKDLHNMINSLERANDPLPFSSATSGRIDLLTPESILVSSSRLSGPFTSDPVGPVFSDLPVLKAINKVPPGAERCESAVSASWDTSLSMAPKIVCAAHSSLQERTTLGMSEAPSPISETVAETGNLEDGVFQKSHTSKLSGLVALGLDPADYLVITSPAKAASFNSRVEFPPLSVDEASPKLGLRGAWSSSPSISADLLDLSPIPRTMRFTKTPHYRDKLREVWRDTGEGGVLSASSALLAGMIMAHMQDVPILPKCLRLRGGGKLSSLPPRAPKAREAKKKPPSTPSFPPPRNQIPLPIEQLSGMAMAVADSSLVSDEKGLFTLLPTDTDELLCLYSGERLRDLSSINPDSKRYDYIWSNQNHSLIIDAYLQHSCYGRYANDALFESKCNAVIEMRKGKIYLVSTRPLAANEEIFVNYGDGYWAARFHKYRNPDSSDLSEFQKTLINAYHIIPLPDGTAVTKAEAKRKRTPVLLPPLPPTPTVPLSDGKLDTLLDTYGSSKNFSVSLTIDNNSSAHMHQLMASLLSNPLTSSVRILKTYLREYNKDIKLRLWRRKSKVHYGACTPDGTCGYQFLYQMYLRGLRASNGACLDDFPKLLSMEHVSGFRVFLEGIISKFDVGPVSLRPSMLAGIRTYLEWLGGPSPRPSFSQANWLDDGSVIRVADSASPFTLATEGQSPQPFISENWIFIENDTKFVTNDSSFTLGQVLEMVDRNNFGVLLSHHYFPLPSVLNPLEELEEALFSLVESLRLHFAATSTPRSLIVNRCISSSGPIINATRAYHSLPRAQALTSLPTAPPARGLGELQGDPLVEDLPVISPSMLEILSDTYGMDSSACVSLSLDSSDSALLSMRRLISAISLCPPDSAGEVLKNYLRNDGSICLRLWKPNSIAHYDACVPDGTCGFQFLYQMHLRALRASPGERQEDFPVLLSSEYILGFRQYLEALVSKFDSPSLSEYARGIKNIKKYLDWLDIPVSLRPSYHDSSVWMDTGSALLLADQATQFSLAAFDLSMLFPRISKDWAYIYVDSSSPNQTAGFSLAQLEEMILRDNFGIMTGNHFYPLPSYPDARASFERALAALAVNLRLNWESSSASPVCLVQLMSSSSTGQPVPRPRRYHTSSSGTSLPAYVPSVIDLSKEDLSLSSPFPRIDLVEELKEVGPAQVEPVSSISSPASFLASVSEEDISSTFLGATIRTQTAKPQVARSRPRRPPLLTKSEFRLPWNSPEWGKSPPSASESLVAHRIALRGIKIPSTSASNYIQNKKDSLQKVQTALASGVASHHETVPPVLPLVPSLSTSPNKNSSNCKKRLRTKRGKTDSPAPMSYVELYQYLCGSPEKLGLVQHPSTSTTSLTADISICTLNINSLSSNKLTCVLAAMFYQKIDVFVLTDTRHRESTVKGYNTQVKDLLGPHSRCIHSPVAPHSTKRGFQSSVGGQLIIISHTWAGALIDHFKDPSNLGLVSGVTLSTGKGSLLIMGNYWPYPSTDEKHQDQQGLWSRASQFLDAKKIKKSPKEFIQNYITRQSDRHIAKSSFNTSVVCGDFNHHWNDGKYQLQGWASSNNWACPSVDHVHASKSPIFTYTRKGVGNSWIDYHLIAPASAAHQIYSTTSFDGPFWEDVSDHRPIQIHLSVPGGRGATGTIVNPHPHIYHPSPRPSVDKTDKKRLQEYQVLLDEYLESADPPVSPEHAASNLLNLSYQSVVVSAQVFPSKGGQRSRPRSSYKDGWSPTAIAIKYQRIAILEILGHYQGTKGRVRWRTLDEQSVGIKKIVDAWIKSVLKIKWKPPDTGWQTMNASPHGPSYWTTLSSMGKVQDCIKILEDLKYKLHGKQRQILRENINAAVKLRENMIKEGKIRKYNKAVLRETEHYNPLSSVTLPTGEILEDPLAIHQAHTDHYRKAFSTPNIHKDGIHHTDWDWKTGGTKEDFLARIDHHKIPSKYQDIIWNAMTSVPKASEVRAELNGVFDLPPSFHEFCNALSSKSGKTAGGITGLTYTHMQAWSLTFKQSVYDNLISIMQSKDPPDWWKWRWLCPIPKAAEDNSLAGQRPVTLVEVTRKTWIALLIFRINASWNKHDILHPSQHGFRAKRGTDTALIALQALFEQSTENESSLFLSSWDISKAFDSLSKQALRFSWIRLGVPTHIADFLVSLDEMGHTIVRTPYSAKLWDKKKYAGFTGNRKRKAFFNAARGTGQGDVGSPINWDAAFDILLCALSSVKEDRFYTLDSSGILSPALDIAYADDLLSGMSSLEGIQEKAKIVSAFSIIFGLDIATSKLRTFLHTSKVPSESLFFSIYTSGWVEHAVPICVSGTLKALGMLYDISSPQLHKSQFLATKLKAERACNIVCRSRGSRAQLIKVVNNCIAKRSEYTGKFSSWTMEQMEAIEQVFTQTYKHLTYNLSSFPTELLYLNTERGGLGLPRLSDVISAAKYSIFQRHQHAGGIISSNIDTLLYNATVQSSQVPVSSTGVTIHARPKLSASCWANSMIHYANEGDLLISRQGSTLQHHPTSTIISAAMPEARPQPWRFVNDRHISILGDLYSCVPGSPSEWHDFSSTLGKALVELQVGNPPDDSVPLRSKQFWLPSCDANFPRDTIVEIMGFTHDDPPLLNIRKLRTNNRSPVGRLQAMCASSDTLLGAASQTSLSPLDALGISPRRVYLDPPPKGSTLRWVSFISAPTSCMIYPPLGNSQWLPPELKSLLSLLGPFSIFSDGSWSSTGSPWSHITGDSPTHHGSVGIAILSDLPNWRDLPIIIMQVDKGQELGALAAYSMEVLGISIGMSIGSQLLNPDFTIFSDCQAAVKKLHKLKDRVTTIRSKTRDASLLSATVSLWNSMEGANVTWVKGHPEREEPDASLWTREMWGNHLSDRAAAGVLNCSNTYQYQNLYSNLLFLTPFPPLDALSVTKHLIPVGDWYFGDAKGQLVSPSIIDRVQHGRFIKYLLDRDAYRAERKLPPKWQFYNFHLVSKFWKMSSSPTLRNLKNRLIFDKHWHPGNMAKNITDPYQFSLAAKCPFCTSPDSASHWSAECLALPRSRRIREAAIKYIRDLVSSTAAAQSEWSFKSAIFSLRDDFMSFLIGNRKSSEAWMGLWTSDQLDHFGSHGYHPPTLVKILHKLFYDTGSYLADTVILLWQSRQKGLWELATQHGITPIQNFTPPQFIFNPCNLELVSHTADELISICSSASEEVPLPYVKISLYRTNRKLRLPTSLTASSPNPLNSEINLCSSSLLLSPSLQAPVLPPLVLPQPPIVKKRKKCKQRSLTLKFKAQEERRKKHGGTRRTALDPLGIAAVTPISVLLNMTTSSSSRQPRVDSYVQHVVSYPSSPPRTSYKRSSSGKACDSRVETSSSQDPKQGGRSSSYARSAFSIPSPPLHVEEGSLVASSALRKTCQSPIRGHDPD
jgi:ribonuclease HI